MKTLDIQQKIIYIQLYSTVNISVHILVVVFFEHLESQSPNRGENAITVRQGIKR